MAAAGAAMGQANVAAVYLVHGTFCGNDLLGLLTELARVAPDLAERLRRASKGLVDAIIGETGNYTAHFARRMEQALSAGAERTIPVRLLHWSGQNHHIGRADGAVRLIDELARQAESTSSAADSGRPRRVLLWGHSHGGNVFAIASNLLGGDAEARAEFFHTAQPFYRSGERTDFPAWQRVAQLLEASPQPLGGLAVDMVTFGTPVRYGWETRGYAKLLHFNEHKPHDAERHWRAPFPRCHRVLTGQHGDLIQQIGIAGSGMPPFPLAWRTFLANRRLRKLIAADSSIQLLKNLGAGARVPHEGQTLLVDYADPARVPWRHLFGHALYTRSRWLPLHCELVAREFYGHESASV